MPQHSGIGTVDWIGLNEALQEDSEQFTSLDPTTQVDFEGLNKELEFGLVEKLNFDASSRINVDVSISDNDTPWYETAFSDAPNWAANRIIDSWYAILALPTLGASLIPLAERMHADMNSDNEAFQTKLAKEKQDQWLETDFAPEIVDFFTGDLPKGVESGAVQFVELIMGGKAETIQDKLEKVEIAGLVKEFQDGNTTVEDFNKELKWYQERAENIPLARDIVAGITNSLMIMGSLAATGGIASFSTTGLKIGSKAWMKAWGKGMLAQGKNTWKLMGAGATIGALNESVQEERLAVAKGEEFTFWDWMAEVGKNTVTKHSQAILEGVSEGVLLGMPMGGVNMAKWMGKPVRRMISKGGKQVEVIENLGTNKVRKLMNSAKTPELRKFYAKHLKEQIADRKSIAGQLAKNFGKKMINGLFVETFTEQLTDVASDIMEGSHGSAFWLMFGDDKEKAEALRNLIVEASVGVFLGSGIGISSAWKRNVLEEVEERYGVDVAREFDLVTSGEKERDLLKKMKKAAKDPNQHNKESQEEAAKDITVQDQGSGKHIPIVEDEADEEAMGEVKANNASIIAQALQDVDELPDPNILDYTFRQGKLEIENYLNRISDKDSKYSFSSYMTESAIEGTHEMNEKVHKQLVQLAIERGLIEKTKGITKENQIALAKDLAVGILLNFEQDGWNFVKHKWKSEDNIDFAIQQAQQLSKPEHKLVANKRFEKLKGEQTVGIAQQAARRKYKEVIGEYINIVQQSTILETSIDDAVHEEAFPTEGSIIDTAIEEVDESNRVPDEDWDLEYQTAPVDRGFIEKKAKAIADLTGVVLESAVTQGNLNFIVFKEPTSGITFTIDGSDLAYDVVQKQALILKHGKKMHAVAFKSVEDGEVYKGNPGESHADAMVRLDDERQTDIEDAEVEPWVSGFIDASGKFYTRKEAQDVTGMLGESFSQGVASTPLGDIKFQSSVKTGGDVKYSTITDGFNGNTVRQFLDHIVAKGHVSPVSMGVVEALLQYVGDKQLVIDGTLDPIHAGATAFPNETIHINPNATLWHNGSVFDTLAHEMVHAHLHSFMNSGTNAAATFNGKIRGVRNLVKKVISAQEGNELFESRWLGTFTELRTWLANEDHRTLITKALKSDEEFLASVFSDTQFIKYITDNISVGGPKNRLTGWRKIFNAIKDQLSIIGVTKIATEELFNIMEKNHAQVIKFRQGKNRRFSPRLLKEQKRLSKNVTSGYVAHERNDDDAADDAADPLQEWEELEDEGENQIEKASIENFIKTMAPVWDMTELEYRDHLRDLDSFESYIEEFDKFDEENSFILTKKIDHLYKGYHRTFKTVDEFRDAFLRRKYLNVVKKSAKPGYIFMGIKTLNPISGKQEYSYQMRKVKDVYRDGNGKQRNTYKRNTVLEGFIPELEKKLNLAEGTLGIAYIEGFESYKNGKITKRTNLARLDNFMLGKKKNDKLPRTQNLANMIWDAAGSGATKDGMMYIGNFAGKNTLPILTFKQKDKKMILKALDEYTKVFNQNALEEFRTDYTADPRTYKAPQQYGSTTRAILEDLWFKREDGQSAKEDWNRMMKRSPKWNAEDTGILISEEAFGRQFGNAAINGMKMDGSDIIINAAVVSSCDEEIVRLKGYDNVEREISLAQLMINELGTSTIDGASFFIIGHFDKAYSLAHGTLKSGAIKNVYASRVGEDPLFLKHAMHGLSKESPLAQYMIDNNLAVLISDEAMKEGPTEKIIGAAELQDSNAFTAADAKIELKMSQFSRHSESQYENLMSGATKQLMNGTSFSDLYNEILAQLGGETGEINNILKNLSDAVARQTTTWFKKNSTPEAMHKMLRDVVYNPKSPQEEKVSHMWVDLIEPLDGQTDKTVRGKYFGAWNHAHTAEVLRARMQFKLNEMLAGKIPGARAVLQPNVGWANDVNDVKPITSNYNLANILISGLTVKADIKKAAFPESGLYGYVTMLQELQKQEQRAHNLEDKDEKKQKLKDIAIGRAATITKIKELNSKRLENIVTSKTSTLSPHTLVDWTNPAIQIWKDEVVFGTFKINKEGVQVRQPNGILDEETGRLRQGWAIMTEDQADELGVKPGDWVIAVITPTDSPLGVIGVRVASIIKSNSSKNEQGRKTADNSKAIFNSEWLQTMAGKDFDIDTISILTYDERYWTREDFEKLAKISSKIPQAYSKKVAEETKDLFEEKNFTPKDKQGKSITVTKDNVFSEDIIREAYSILMNGVPKGKDKRRRFSLMGDSFMELDSAYLHDPAPIINERLHHTAASAINMRAMEVLVPFINNKGKLVTKFSRKGEVSDIKIDFNVRNKKWLRLHINHLHMTNAEVDFPNKTTRLAYLSDPQDPAYKRMMGMYFWGLGDVMDYKHVVAQTKDHDTKLKINNLEHIFDALKSFQKMLFDDAFQLARGRNAQTFEKLDYFDTAQQIKRAQNILRILERGDTDALLALVNTWIQVQEKQRNRTSFPEDKLYKQMTRKIEQQGLFLKSFAKNLKVDNVYDYPLFNSIKNINLDALLDYMPGNIYRDHLINQVLASLNTINYYPDLQTIYDDQLKHANNIADRTAAEGNPFKVSERVARKPAQIILDILGLPVGDQRKAVEEVRWMLNQPTWDDRIKRLSTPADVENLQEALRDFRVLEARVGKSFEPFERDGELINVDTEVITFTRMLQSLDALDGRMQRAPNQSPQQYWRKQLRGFRYEVNQILHAFDEKEPLRKGRRVAKQGEKVDKRKHLSQVMEMQRAAQSATYPLLMKNILKTQFLQFKDDKVKATMVFSGENILFSTDGAGQLLLSWRGKTYNHNEINDQKTNDTITLYKMLTQRSVGDQAGFWEGMEDSRQGTFNRHQLGKVLSFSRNLTMERREQMLEEYLIKHLYEGTRGFTSTDQKAFWMSMIAQTSDQGIQDKKATGLIVNQTIYDKKHPFKFQSNHIALNLLGLFEPEMQNLWLQLYNIADTQRSPEDRAKTLAALRDGQDSTVEMLYQDTPVNSTERTSHEFFSDYAADHAKLAKDEGFVNFYKYAKKHTWEQSLQKLKDLSKGTLMLKALSENGVYFEDLVRDLKTLSDREFMQKYKEVDLTSIRLAIQRYMDQDVVGNFISQRAGESDVAFRTRSNLLILYYQVNSAKKREGARNNKLTFIRKIASNVIGYDMHALLREKKTHIFDHKNELIGFSWTEDGIRDFTVGDAIIAMKTHATRTFQGIGESIIAITKSQHVNRTLATHQVILNNQAKHFEDVAKLLSNTGFRDEWRVQFEHKKKDKRTPHNDRTRFIVDLLQEIAPSSLQQLEIRRQQIFTLAEDLKTDRGLYLTQDSGGNVAFNFQLGGKVFRYASARSMMAAHFKHYTATQKLALLGALDIREMYDIHVPNVIKQGISYLTFTKEQLAETLNIDSSLKVDAMIQKYQTILDLIKDKHGNYMPHQFAVSKYRNEWLKGYLDQSVKALERKIIYHKKNNHNIYLATLDLVKDRKLIREMAYLNATKVWDSISHDWGSGAIIPNFMERNMPDATGYTKTDPTIHFNYITKLIKGFKNDALYADWMIYQASAREAGERYSTMEITRRWYGDQIGTKELRSVSQKWSDIKPGQEINFNRQSFILEPTNDVGYYGNVTVSGVVSKVTDTEVFLRVDAPTAQWKARMALKRHEDRAAAMEAEGWGGALVGAKTYATLQNMINKQILNRDDFLTFDMSKLNEAGASELIILGTKRILKDPQIIGRYKRTEVWGEDIMGKAQENTVNLYAGQGVVERLKAKTEALRNLNLMGDEYEGKVPVAKYKMFKYAHAVVNGVFGGFKKLSGLFYMGLASAGPARFTNQFGAIVNNLIDSPIYNYARWKEGSELWSKIKHGQMDMMEESEKRIYRTVVGLGLTDSNNILAIALEAANIKPEDMLVEGSKVDTIKWLARLFRDSTNYDKTYKKLESLSHAYNMETDPVLRTQITGEINEIKQRWQAKMHKLLSTTDPQGPQLTSKLDDKGKPFLVNEKGERATKEEIRAYNKQLISDKELWKKANALAKSDPKINIAQEQGFTQAMAVKLFARVAWKGFFTSNVGMGFQAKAEKMRIPAFFIGYTTAIRMGYDETEALQLAVNSVELRHAFYGAAHKQFGANTKVGSVGFQYAQYQYNAISKAVRIIREAIPQMIGFAHNKPEGISNLKHAMSLLKLIQNSVDARGKQLYRPGTRVELKEINLMHGILLKIAWTGVMMNVGTRVFYGLTNIQDPVGQMVYRQMDYLFDILGAGVDFDDEGDMDELAYAIQDMALPLGLLYKLGIQSMTSVPIKGFDKTYFVGRVDNTFDFSWRLVNTINTAAYQLGVSDEKPNEKNEILFDMPWLVDDFASGVKVMGWTSGDNVQKSYKKRGLYYGFDSDMIPYMTVEARRKKTFAGGRFLDTDKKGVSGFGKGGSNIRALYLLDPLTYLPFLDRLTGGKTLFKTIRGK